VKCAASDVVDSSFWGNQMVELYKNVLDVNFLSLPEVHSFVQKPRIETSSMANVSELGAIKSMRAKPTQINEQEEKPQNQLEEKYDKLYTNYMALKKEREELINKLKELEIRESLIKNKENIIRPTYTSDKQQLNQVLIVTGVFLLLGMVFPNILRFLLS